MTKKTKPTIADVALAAQVSRTTVSRFMNGRLKLPDATADRIRGAIMSLDYRPNVLARNLSLGRSRALGLVLPDIANPFFAQLASAAETEAARRGYHLILCSTQSNPEQEIAYLHKLQAKGLDGVVFLTEHASHAPLAEHLADIQHVVLVDEGVDNFTGHRVFADNRLGGELATRHLLDLGHRRIGYIGGPTDLMTARERRQGYMEALHDAGMDADPALQVAGPYRQETGALGLRRLLASSDPPSAIFAASDAIAIGVIREAVASIVRIPDDLSLVGFDGVAVGELLNPPLTTISQPIEMLGRQGVRDLIGIIEGEVAARTEVRLPVELVVRSSTSPAGTTAIERRQTH